MSIIVPCYNVENKIKKCIISLKKIKFPKNNYEIIFVDDHSSDNTVTIINSEIEKQSNWLLHRLKNNSGSPSRPRNIGTSLAKGEYVFFLDSDDEIIDTSLQKQYDIAKQENACIVRGHLILNENGHHHITNQITDFPHEACNKEKIKKIITIQSTTTPSLIKKKLIIDNSISWNENLRVGEDTLFLIDVLNHAANITYLDEPLFIYNKIIQEEASSTQIYGARELKSHLFVWSEAEKRLSRFNFSYISKRGSVGLLTSFRGILHYYQNDIDNKLFKKFSTFINAHWEVISQYHLRTRYKKALNFLHENKYHEFFQTLKPYQLSDNLDLFDYIKEAIPNDHCKQTNLFTLTRNYIKNVPPQRVLDFGCCTGDSSNFFHGVLPNTEWFGITTTELTSNNRKKFITKYDSSKLPYKNNSFDLIFCNQTLECNLNPTLVLSDIVSLLKRDGILIGQTSQFNTSHSFNYWNFSIYGFKRMIENAGMKLIELRPSIDSFSLMERSYTNNFKKHNRYFSGESPKNFEIEQMGQDKKQSIITTNYRKLIYSGQFCFMCTLK